MGVDEMRSFSNSTHPLPPPLASAAAAAAAAPSLSLSLLLALAPAPVVVALAPLVVAARAQLRLKFQHAPPPLFHLSLGRPQLQHVLRQPKQVLMRGRRPLERSSARSASFCAPQ